MKLYDFLQFSVCVFSILAAGFWLQSAATTLPKLTKNLNWDGTGPFPEALKSQSRWSAAGRRVPVWRLFPNRLPLCCRIFNQTDLLPVWYSASNAKRLCAASLILAVGVLVGYMIRRPRVDSAEQDSSGRPRSRGRSD